MLVPSANHTIHFHAQTGIPVVYRLDDLPLRQRFTELLLLFVHSRPQHNGFNQIVFLAGPLQQLLEVAFSGVDPHGIFEDRDPPVQVRLGIDFSIRLGNSSGKCLPVLLRHVDFQRLKQRVIRVVRQLIRADGKGCGKIGSLSWCFAST